MTRIMVPPASELVKMTNDELVALEGQLSSHSMSCQNTIDDRARTGVDATGVKVAKSHYDRGIATVRNLISTRAGQLPTFVQSKPIHSFTSYYQSMKDGLRLIGLCEQELVEDAA